MGSRALPVGGGLGNLRAWGCCTTWFRILSIMFPQANTSMVQLELKTLVNLAFFAVFVNTAFMGFVVWTRVPPRLQMPQNKRAQLVTIL